MLGKRSYVPVEAVKAPERPYFAAVPLLGLPKITAPRVCQLCGAGFRDWRALVCHCDGEHGGFNEYRKRLFWEADRCLALGLPSVRKRSMVANATTAMLYSVSEGGRELAERRQEACAVCARKDWLEARLQCHLWKALPGGDAGELAEEREAEAGAAAEDSQEGSEDEERRRRAKRRLRDADGVYYVGDAAKVHQHLGVEHYAQAMPRIPLEELHASSVQHPRFPTFRWLLHTRRVPTRPQEPGSASQSSGLPQETAHRARGRDHGSDGAAEPVSEPGPDSPALPRCAGVGVEESKVWICRHCRDALCVRDDIAMPGPALANLMWGGREHPAYQDISEATRVLLGRGRLVHQKIILKHGAPDEQPVGLGGNCILLTQPKSSEIIQTLPPPRETLTDNFVVLFTTGRQDVRNAKILHVPREQYLRCARLRTEVCEVFADAIVSEEAALENLPEQGVPEAFVEGALEVQEAEHFKPSMRGPATIGIPDAAAGGEVEARSETDEVNTDDHADHCDDRHGAVAQEHSERVDQGSAENLIGLEEAHVDDPGARFSVLQRKLEMMQKETKKLEQRERQRESTTQTAAELQVGIEGQREHCKQIALDIRDLAKKMGTKYELELERAVSAAETPDENTSGGGASQRAAPRRVMGLKVQAGAALSSFDARCWPLGFTFFLWRLRSESGAAGSSDIQTSILLLVDAGRARVLVGRRHRAIPCEGDVQMGQAKIRDGLRQRHEISSVASKRQDGFRWPEV